MLTEIQQARRESSPVNDPRYDNVTYLPHRRTKPPIRDIDFVAMARSAFIGIICVGGFIGLALFVVTQLRRLGAFA